MKWNYTFTFLFAFTLLVASNSMFAQQEVLQSRTVQLFGKENPKEKEMRKAFRKMRRKVSGRPARKKLKEHQENYLKLISEDKAQSDSIEQQRAKVDSLYEKVQQGKTIQKDLEKLRAENDSLAAVMRAYVRQIDSLNALNEELEKSLLKDYYFKLEDFEKPKVYLYENTTYPELGHYWKISSIPDSNILITESFLLDFTQVESFTERYDSIGAKVVEYILIEGLDSIQTEILASDVYRWNSGEQYAYEVKQIAPGIWKGFEKRRIVKPKTSMEIMGEQLEVRRFEDHYTYKFGIITHMKQQSFYSKEYGLVRFVRFNERTKVNETFILSKIYSEEEWMELQE